jgi:hypothetical protein
VALDRGDHLAGQDEPAISPKFVRGRIAADTGSLDPAPEPGPSGVALTLGGATLLAAGGGLGVVAYRRRRRA